MKPFYQYFFEDSTSAVLGSQPIYDPNNLENSDSYAPGDTRLPFTNKKVQTRLKKKKRRIK